MTPIIFPFSPFRSISITMGCTQSTTGATVDEPEGLSSTLSLSARSIISTAAGGATTLHSLSFNSLCTTASTLFDINLGNISQLKHEISSNRHLVRFIKEYLKSSIYTQNFFTAVKDSLRKIREAEPLIRDAVILYEEGSNPQAALEKLRKFKEEVDPFMEKFVEEFMIVVERQNSTLNDLNSAVFAAVLICTVVLAALAAPPAATAAAAAASSAMAPLQQLVGSIWNQFQSSYEGEKDVINSLKKGTQFTIHELDSIKVLVEKLEIIKIRPTIHNTYYAIEEKEEVVLKVVMDEIKPKAGTSAKSDVEDLEKEVHSRGAELKTATAAIRSTTLPLEQPIPNHEQINVDPDTALFFREKKATLF